MVTTSFFASLVAQLVKNLPAMHETRVRSLGQEDPLEEGMETHSSILAWRITRTEEPGGLQSIELQSDTTAVTEHARTPTEVDQGCFYHKTQHTHVSPDTPHKELPFTINLLVIHG